MDTREVYIKLYKDMIQLMRNIDIIIVELQKTSNYFEMLFGEETNRYVFRIILAKFVLENPKEL